MQSPQTADFCRYAELSVSQPPCSNKWLGKRPWFVAVVVASGFLAFSSFSLAHGHSGGHDSGSHDSGSHMGGHQHEGRYWDPFWQPWHPGYAGSYDSDYWYTPTPDQATTAQKRVNNYLVAVKKGRRRAAKHRYIAVETLRPTKRQLEDYVKKRAEAKSAAGGGTQLSNRWVEPSQLRCVMVFDTESKKFVGSGCYVIGSLPPVGEISKFETVSAEFVGSPAL